MKKCPKCSETLPVEAFSKSLFRKSGRSCYCRNCDRRRARDRRLKNPESEKEKARLRVSRWRNASDENWEKARLSSLNWHRKNKEVANAASRLWRKNNLEKARLQNVNYDLKAAYDISLAEYEAMLFQQDGVCKICKGVNKSRRRLAVDHSHATGVLRGLLCSTCNLMLGYAKDSPALLRKAAEYLENAENKNNQQKEKQIQ